MGVGVGVVVEGVEVVRGGVCVDVDVGLLDLGLSFALVALEPLGEVLAFTESSFLGGVCVVAGVDVCGLLFPDAAELELVVFPVAGAGVDEGVGVLSVVKFCVN